MDLQPPKRRVPDPEGDWKGADLANDERVDDDFIAENSARTYPPLQPEDEKLFPSGLSVARNDSGEPEGTR